MSILGHFIFLLTTEPVSYTHLDVYKRQGYMFTANSIASFLVETKASWFVATAPSYLTHVVYLCAVRIGYLCSTG